VDTNKFGLSRKDFLESIKSEVRRRCGFGCVVCGCAIVQSHHFDPPFAEAQQHDPRGITLLCGTCHDRVERGIVDIDTIRKANASPWCLKHRYSRDILFLGRERVPIRIGPSRFRAETIAMYDEDVVFGFSQPECPDGPWRLNAVLTDRDGHEMLCIVDNEWRVGVDRFDVRTKGRVLTIRDGPRDIVLQMNLEARSELRIHRLHMQYRGFDIDADDAGFTVLVPVGARFNHRHGDILADIGIWMKSSGECLVAANQAGGAAIALGTQG
jgi:hypothetical protein